MEAYVDHRQLLYVIKDRDPGAPVAGLRSDPARKVLEEALEEAAQVLAQTTTAFKSKQLGVLLERLNGLTAEDLLQV